MPNILYKYSYWDKDNGEKSFGHKILSVPQIYFSSPSAFRDPFDCQIPPNWRAKTDAELVEYFEARYPDGLESIKESLKMDRERHLSIIEQRFITKVNTESGVCCLAKTPRSSLLWAHYAAGHRGFCVGLDHHFLDEQLQKLFEQRQIMCDDLVVQYCRRVPVLNPFHENDREWFLQHYRYKAHDWRYEHEHRFVMIKGGTLSAEERSVNISPGCIFEVILGCRIEPEAEDDIRRAVALLRTSNPAISIKRAVISGRSYEYDLIDA